MSELWVEKNRGGGEGRRNHLELALARLTFHDDHPRFFGPDKPEHRTTTCPYIITKLKSKIFGNSLYDTFETFALFCRYILLTTHPDSWAT